jgi:hypothetical protein
VSLGPSAPPVIPFGEHPAHWDRPARTPLAAYCCGVIAARLIFLAMGSPGCRWYLFEVPEVDVVERGRRLLANPRAVWN